MAEKPFIATVDLFVSTGVRAHRAGEVVPADNGERNGWQDSVAREGTKAADEAKSA